VLGSRKVDWSECQQRYFRCYCDVFNFLGPDSEPILIASGVDHNVLFYIAGGHGVRFACRLKRKQGTLTLTDSAGLFPSYICVKRQDGDSAIGWPF